MKRFCHNKRCFTNDNLPAASTSIYCESAGRIFVFLAFYGLRHTATSHASIAIVSNTAMPCVNFMPINTSSPLIFASYHRIRHMVYLTSVYLWFLFFSPLCCMKLWATIHFQTDDRVWIVIFWTIFLCVRDTKAEHWWRSNEIPY